MIKKPSEIFEDPQAFVKMMNERSGDLSRNVDKWKEVYEEWGSDCGCSFLTSGGIKTVEQGKIYDKNLDEIK